MGLRSFLKHAFQRASAAGLVPSPAAGAAPVTPAPGATALAGARVPAEESGGAGQAYLVACAQTRKAWHHTSLLARARPEHIEQVRGAIASLDAEALAALICDISGPLHPGEPAQAQAPWVKKGNALARTAVQAILIPLVALRDAQVGQVVHQAESGERGPQAAGAALDVDQLKSWIVHWIESGTLPSSAGADSRSNDAGLIAQWLHHQALGQARGAPGNDRTQGLDAQARAAGSSRWQRLAVVAVTAPAVESLLVMSKLPASYVDALKAAAPRRAPAPGLQAEQAAAKAGPMARSEADDTVARSVFASMVSAGSALAVASGTRE